MIPKTLEEYFRQNYEEGLNYYHVTCFANGDERGVCLTIQPVSDDSVLEIFILENTAFLVFPQE